MPVSETVRAARESSAALRAAQARYGNDVRVKPLGKLKASFRAVAEGKPIGPRFEVNQPSPRASTKAA